MTSKIVVLGFEGQYFAEGMLETFQDMQERGLLELEDAVVVSRGISSKIDVEQTQTKKGKYTLKGSGLGLLAGLLLGGPILGLAGGAAIGAMAGSMKDYGIDDKFIDEVSEWLRPETSALFLLVKEAKGREVLEELSKFDAFVLTTTLESEQEQRLRQALEK